MKMKKLIATLGLTAALIGVAGQASAASLNGVSVNYVDSTDVRAAFKNDNAYPVTVTAKTWVGHLKKYIYTTVELEPEEKVYMSLPDYRYGTEIHSIGHTWSGDKDLGTFWELSHN